MSLPIWQYVFDLQEDWDITIKEASAVLIQLCAPRDSIKHFYKVKREGENLRLKVLLNNFSALSPDVGSKHRLNQILHYLSNTSGESSSVKSERNLAQEASDYASQSRTSIQDEGSRSKPYSKAEEEKKMRDDQRKFLEEKVKGIHSSSSIYDEEVRAYNKTDPRQEEDFMGEEYQFEFYVDNYSDEKIKEIISIFRNDFKPPKNLWIENMNVQGNSEANYFNDVFADDDNYNTSEDASPKPGGSRHNEEIDDIGYNISDSEKSKQAKPKKEEPKPAEVKPKAEKPNEDTKYNDRIKPMQDMFDVSDGSQEEPVSKPEKPDEKSKKPESKASAKPGKSKKKKPTDYLTEKELKVHKAKDGLNIEINTDPMSDLNKRSKGDSAKTSKKGSKTPKSSQVVHADDFNKTRKLPPNLLEDISDDEGLNYEDSKDEDNNISVGKIAQECEDEIDEKLLMIGEEKAKLELERAAKRKKDEKKSSKSKPRVPTGQKSTREGYGQKKKRTHSHKKRGSASMMQELKKKMGFINAQTSRGRAAGEGFLNYSLDEINQKLQFQVINYQTSTGTHKGMKKRLNKSFENVFSACASTSRTRQNLKKGKKMKKKPISSSPRRLAMRDKKNSQSHAKTPNTTSRKKLNNSLYSNRNNHAYNKELTDKL